MTQHTIYALDDAGAETTAPICIVADAAEGAVNDLVAAQPRNGWKLFRLQNGDLIVGFFPEGDDYETVTAHPDCP